MNGYRVYVMVVEEEDEEDTYPAITDRVLVSIQSWAWLDNQKDAESIAKDMLEMEWTP